VREEGVSPRLLVVECPLLRSCQAELGTLATRFSIIQGTLQARLSLVSSKDLP